MKIECPMCHKALECESQWCGQKAQCPYCKNKFIVTEIMLDPVASRNKAKWRYAFLGAAAAVLCIAAGLGLGRVFFGPRTPTAVPENANAVAAVSSTSQTHYVHAGVSAAPAAVVDGAVDAPSAPATEAASDATAAAAKDENNTAASQVSEQSTEEVSAEDGDYTYEYYEGESVPYYLGYYYVGGVWVWHGHGRPPFPPPHFRPVPKPHSAKHAPAKAASTKPASAKGAPGKSVKSSPVPAKTTSSAPVPAKPVENNQVPEQPAPAKPVRVKRSTVRSVPHHGGGRVSAPRGLRR